MLTWSMGLIKVFEHVFVDIQGPMDATTQSNAKEIIAKI
jgi:hypothetical protein